MSFEAAGVSVVLFDAGNTLIELDYEGIAEMFSARGFPRDPALLRAAADGMRPALDAFIRRARHSAEGRDTFSHFLRGFLDRLEVPGTPAREALAAHIGESWSSLWRRPTEGSGATLEALHRRGFRLGVVSNSNGSVARDAPGWPGGHLLETVVDSGVVGVEKPDPEIFRIALSRLGARPEEAIHVGDLPSVDVAGARAAGIGAVLIDPGDLFPDVEAPRIRKLPELLDLLSGAPTERG